MRLESRRTGLLGLTLACAVLAGASSALGEPRHAIAMHGEPTLPAGFAHFRYVNPAAPKGGRLVHGLVGTFNSLNPFIVKGLAIPEIRGYVIESLMTRNYDEPFTLYGLIANGVETNPARTTVTFTLDPAARFSDGRPVTAADVLFSWALLRDKGRPNHRTYYSKVIKAESLGERTVRFDLTGSEDRELPLILALMPVLPKHAIDPETFEQTSFAAPLGSGPYLVAAVKPGDSVTFRRNPDYWGRNLGVNRGAWNFDEIRFDFFRDGNTQFEAFKKGLFDVRAEIDPGRWESGYDFPALRDGRVIKDTIPTGLPQGMNGFVFNTRRALFADVRVREALGLLFDFEWVNRNFFFNRYKRTKSYYAGSELDAHGRPADAIERGLLARYPDAVRSDVLAGTWAPPATDGGGRDRATLKRALALLAAAGYDLDGTELRARTTREPFSFEILVKSKDQERLALAYARDLKRAGVGARVRLVDAVQYERRLQAYDFDMIQYHWSASLSPGNEQAFYWGSAAAAESGTRNYMGVKSAAADAMIAAMLKAEGRADFLAAVRALDRVLISGFYVVPLFHLSEQWVARRAAIARPSDTPLSGYLPETWWRVPPQ